MITASQISQGLCMPTMSETLKSFHMW